MRAIRDCAFEREQDEDYSTEFDADPPTQPIPSELMSQLIAQPVRS